MKRTTSTVGGARIGAGAKPKRGVRKQSLTIGVTPTLREFLDSPETAQEILLPILPPDSELRIFPVTESQVENQSLHWGRMRKSADDLIECGVLA